MSFVLRSSRLLARQGAQLMQARNFADAAPLKLTLAGANKVFYDSVEVKQVDVPSYSGDFGILATHVPTLAVLKPGVVTVYENDGAQKKVFVSSGTITVNVDSSVQVLAEEAHPLEDLDARAAQEALSAAQSELSSAKDDKARAEATLAVEVAESIVKAVQ
ncbi:ATP synthase subunit delta, mitochondrial [Contarinia nasturtii]|uniref:ATP synthase subunit delta, mitochondrial n=1 Tax=Contarinia nasturtii TaxID=265458 RepID=UPI0012D3E42C|nr:ATP synthase subunit delta, mitochondrial [Contarinia nasturtii]XP_031625238.1 ATP synthase subunit delta, mitochondrial [Contarinia nasturtii]XP_031625239.1 ATP synthase subunit delta, mitochondrial [Contarinia nasturtii]